MILVQKLNRQLEIADSQLVEYLEKGYSVFEKKAITKAPKEIKEIKKTINHKISKK